jgi:hypothetical protein
VANLATLNHFIVRETGAALAREETNFDELVQSIVFSDQRGKKKRLPNENCRHGEKHGALTWNSLRDAADSSFFISLSLSF